MQCVFELWNAIKLGHNCELTIILAPEDEAHFKAAVNRDGYSVIDHSLATIHAENAEAFSPADLAKITDMVRSSPGGFATLNASVRSRLARWFETIGGIKLVKQGRAPRLRSNSPRPARGSSLNASAASPNIDRPGAQNSLSLPSRQGRHADYVPRGRSFGTERTASPLADRALFGTSGGSNATITSSGGRSDESKL